LTCLQLYSEPFAPTGNIAAEGSKNLLGRPPLSRLQTVLREAIQNSVDAAKSDGPVTVLVRLRTLTKTQHEALQQSIFTSLAEGAESCRSLRDCLNSESLQVLEICDFGTWGLSGPTNADAPDTSAEPQNFVNFIRNIGAPRDVHHGGGTYGYGKTSFYAMSKCATIVVDSQTTEEGRPVRRLMGCHLGTTFIGNGGAAGKRRFTGRHWWGVGEAEGTTDPAAGDLARQLSASVGMVERSAQQTGTSIMMLAPGLDEEEGRSAEDDIIETVLWNFWPRMTRSAPPSRKLELILEIEGDRVAIPPPESFPPLDIFANAIADIRSGKDVQRIRCGKPQATLGKLAISKGARCPRVGPALLKGSAIPPQACHIALMRPVELVVKYLTGDPFPDSRYEWAGAFVCSKDDEIESAFAEAEPPAHDDWVPDNLPKGHARTFVRVALRDLRQAAKSVAGQIAGTSHDEQRGPSLARTAAKLGRILAMSSSRGPGHPARAKHPSSRLRRSTYVSAPQFVALKAEADGSKRACFEAELVNDGSSGDLWIKADPFLLMDGAAVKPKGLPDEYGIHVTRMALGDSLQTCGEGKLEVGTASGLLKIEVAIPDSAAVGLRIDFEEGESP